MVLSKRAKACVRVGICLTAYIGACAIFVAVRDTSILFSILAIFAIVGAARKLHEAGRWLCGARLFIKHPVWLNVLLAPGAILLGLWYVGFGDGWGFFGLALLYLGIGLVVDHLRDLGAFPSTWGWRILAIAGVLALLGLLGMTFLGASWTVWPVLLGLVALPVGLGLVSEVRLRALEAGSGPRPWWLALIGAVLFLGGLGLIGTLDVSFAFVAAFGVSVLVLMLAIAAKSNADVVIVVVMAAVIWTLTSRSVPLTEFVTGNSGERVVVAFGDSYISGEGANEFYEGTNDAGSNTCRRSPTAYPALLMLEDRPDVPRDLVFLACSGAKADGVDRQLRQFTQLRDQENIDVEVVLLSVGGNDALFGNVGRTCLMPGDCAELSGGWTDNLEQVGTTLDELYADVRAAIPDAPVLVVPYPIPLAEQSCSYSAFSDSEHRFLFDFTTRLNSVVRQSAANAGFYIVDTMPDALAGHRLCDGPASEAGVNFFAANSVQGTLEQTISPINWFHNSLHPNVRGHELMRAALLQWLDTNPDLEVSAASSASTDTDGAVPPSTTGGGDTTIGECQGLAGAELESCTGTWRVQHIGSFLLTTGLLALLVATGAWLLALPIIRISREIFPPRPDDRDVGAAAAQPRETADVLSL
jgi:lysophospholipase L1-like esterase